MTNTKTKCCKECLECPDYPNHNYCHNPDCKCHSSPSKPAKSPEETSACCGGFKKEREYYGKKGIKTIFPYCSECGQRFYPSKPTEEKMEVEFKETHDPSRQESFRISIGEVLTAEKINKIADAWYQSRADAKREVVEELLEKISWFTRYERSIFRANLSEAPEEGTVPMLKESDVLSLLANLKDNLE